MPLRYQPGPQLDCLEQTKKDTCMYIYFYVTPVRTLFSVYVLFYEDALLARIIMCSLLKAHFLLYWMTIKRRTFSSLVAWMIETCHIGMGRGKRERLIHNLNKPILHRVKLTWFDWDLRSGHKETSALDCVIRLAQINNFETNSHWNEI